MATHDQEHDPPVTSTVPTTVRPASGTTGGTGSKRPPGLTGELSYGPPWAHYLGGYQDRLLGGPLGLPGLRYTAPEGVEHKDSTGVVLG
jgi:hypothetical protein